MHATCARDPRGQLTRMSGRHLHGDLRGQYMQVYGSEGGLAARAQRAKNNKRSAAWRHVACEQDTSPCAL
eukprot:7390364-Lingulodinium_polyedra.AAC.1